MTNVPYRIIGLDPEPFRHLFGLSDEALREHGAIRYIADAKPCFPDRVGVRDAEIGERLLLVNYTHQPANSPYRASHAIFVSETAEHALDVRDEIPEAMRVRTLSLRAYDDAHLISTAQLVAGTEAGAAIERMFADPAVAYIHAHYATRGCFAARVERA